jgi:hypothetical protein
MGVAFSVSRVTSAALRALNYDPNVERLRHRSALTLAGAGAQATDSFGDIFTSRLCAPGHGVQVMSQSDTFASEPTGKWVRLDSMRNPGLHTLKRWQLLIAGAGQMGPTGLFGRSVLVDHRLQPLFIASDTVVLDFDEPGSDLSLWVYAYLNTSTGLSAVRSCAYGTSIPRIRLDLLKQIPIPEPESKTLARVAASVRRSVSERERYLASLRAARQIIEELPEMREAHALCASRRAHALAWDGELPTLQGWTYASHGGALASLRKAFNARLADTLEPGGVFYGLLRRRTPCEDGQGVPLITQRDALSVRQLPSWIARPSVPSRAMFSDPHTVVMAGRGTLGEGELFARPIYITPRLSRYALTQDLVRLVPRSEYISTLYAYLSTMVGLRLLRSCAVGTKILQLRLDLLRGLPFPELDSTRTELLRGHHSQCVTAFDEAEIAESEAIRILDEEVLPQWLA